MNGAYSVFAYSALAPTTTRITPCKICAVIPQICSGRSGGHDALNTGTGPTPGTTLASTLSSLRRSSSDIAISLVPPPFPSAFPAHSASTSSSPR